MTTNLQKFIIFSLVIHLFVILTLSIKWYTNTRHSTKAIDITIVKTQSKTKPNKADFMAQNNNIGGGNSNKKNNPSSNKQALFAQKQLNKEQNKTIQNQQQPPINNTPEKKDNSIVTKSKTTQDNLADNKINNSLETQKDITNFDVYTETVPEITSLIQNIERRAKLYAKRPKTRYVSASTQEYRDAKYLDTWRKKIEYLGNKYYPEQIELRNLSGEVLMLVAVRANGQISKVKIEKSSGIKMLDDAAIQTVHLAAPFEPFSKEMRKDTDVLEIIRTWRFNDSNGLSSGLEISLNDY